jgi:diguanylate cyclase (GGDEF)-like protein
MTIRRSDVVRAAPIEDDLRHRLARALAARLDSIAGDAAAMIGAASEAPPDPAYYTRLARLILQLLSLAVRDGQVDARSGPIVDLHETIGERGLTTERLFASAYLTERATLDELAVDAALGATAEAWPVVAQLVRRASFDLLGAYASRWQTDAGRAAITDCLTSLYSRALFDAALTNELERANRFGGTVSLILFDVDHLARINHEHGQLVGDKILERIGITLRNYFRQHDWTARFAEDSMAVLLARTDADRAADLAENLRATVESRLEITDHRDDSRLRVTVSGAVINLNIAPGETIDRERLLADAEAAVARAKSGGRNRIERVDQPYSSS